MVNGSQLRSIRPIATRHFMITPVLFLLRVRPLLAVAACACVALPAHALRPFDGTDAGVAEAGIFELELGGSYLRQARGRSAAMPALVANFGLAGDTEFVVEGRAARQLGGDADGYRSSFGDTGVSIKHLFRHGSLHDGSGVSIASECGLLLPEWHGESGHGASCAAIVSQRWEQGALHFNAGLARTRTHTTERTLGVIAEGPEDWTVRPVAELLGTHELNGGRSHSLLAGAVWKHSEDLSFDLALRRVHNGAASATELRFGLQWSMAMPKL
jgi:hypothetical protein